MEPLTGKELSDYVSKVSSMDQSGLLNELIGQIHMEWQKNEYDRQWESFKKRDATWKARGGWPRGVRNLSKSGDKNNI